MRGRPFERRYGEDEFRNCKVCGTEFIVLACKKHILTKGKFCSRKCSYAGRECKSVFTKGHPIIGGAHSMPHTQETREKMKIINRAKAKRGEDVWNWKGGTGSLRHREMERFEYKDWRESVFKRDNYTCQCCNDRNVYLHADHVLPYSDYPELRFDVDNGNTLCYRCHYKKTFPNKEFDEQSAIKWGVPKKYQTNLV